MIWGTWRDIILWKDREEKPRWWRMVIACHAALTSRSLVPRKFAVAKNLSNVSQICRICSPGIRSARGQWNVRALPPIPHFETPVPSPALFYPEIETAHLRPLFRLFQVLSLPLCFDYKMGLTLRFFVINGRYSKNVVRVPGECGRQDRPDGCWQTREVIMRPPPCAFPGPAVIKTFRRGRGWRINQAWATLCNVHFSSQLLEM